MNRTARKAARAKWLNEANVNGATLFLHFTPIQRVEIEWRVKLNESEGGMNGANEINPFQFNSEIEMKLDDWVAMLKKERIQSIHSFLSVKCNGVDESRLL